MFDKATQGEEMESDACLGTLLLFAYMDSVCVLGCNQINLAIIVHQGAKAIVLLWMWKWQLQGGNGSDSVVSAVMEVLRVAEWKCWGAAMVIQ